LSHSKLPSILEAVREATFVLPQPENGRNEQQAIRGSSTWYFPTSTRRFIFLDTSVQSRTRAGDACCPATGCAPVPA